jgi:2-polyprenyl-3-methyl-5-hydroxy-6-metoxy-1,4-benzoquinol methylase
MSATNDDARRAWDTNAAYWDARMAEGNDFFEVLIWPAVSALLAIAPGERVLDLACGNGLTSRRLAAAGARVCAVDFSEAMLERARARSTDIDYRRVDVCDGPALSALGAFDAVLCNMAIMDIAEVAPMMNGVAAALRPGGRCVLSLMHPAFNNPWSIQMAELEDRDGTLVTVHAVKVPRYLTVGSRLGNAMPGQPVPHPYFHRPLGALLQPAFAAGFVLDALEERAFPPGHASGSSPLSWSGRFSEIPPVLVTRLRSARG